MSNKLFNKKNTSEDEKIMEETELLAKLNVMFNNANAAKTLKVKDWDKCMEAYSNDKVTSQSDYKSDVKSAFIFSIVETIKPLMVDKDPSFVVEPTTPDHAQSENKDETGLTFAQKIQYTFDYETRRQNMPSLLERGVTRAVMGIPCVVYLPWDGSSGKFGEISPKLINPKNFFIDPMAETLQEGEYCIWADYINTNLLKQKFPEKKEMITSEGIDTAYSGGKQIEGGTPSKTLVFVAFVKDYSLDEEDKPKYKNGRMVTYTKSCILDDKKNPYDDGKFPFVMYTAIDDGFSIWGEGVVKQLIPLQEAVNDLNNQVIDNAKMTANMQWIIDKNAGIEKGKLTNRPGLIIRKNPGTEVRRDAPPPMPSYVGDKIMELKRDMETISGIHDVTQGRRPAGITAAAAIEKLQEAGQGRIRLMVKRFERFISELGQMEYSRMKQFWVTPRMIKATENAFGVSFFEISKEDMTNEIPNIFIYGGATMPYDKGTRLQQYIQLAQTQAEDGKPMVDREALLDAMEIKDRYKILARMAPVAEPPAPAPAQQAMPPMMPDVMGGMSPQTLPMPQSGGVGGPAVPPSGMPATPPMMPPEQGVPIAGIEQDVLTPEQQAMMQAMQELGLDPNDPNAVAMLQQNG